MPRKTSEQFDSLLSKEITCDYSIDKLLGKGGMGEVYLAEQLNVGRRLVALKVLNRSCATDSDLVRRFKNEAAAAGKLDHDNIVKIYDCRVTSGGQVYVAMEYIKGKSLKTLISEHDKFVLPTVVEIVKQICAGLSAAHRVGIVHRDLKPDNIMLTEKDDRTVVKILDFGIARLAQTGFSSTVPGIIMGSAEYMSPEQAEGLTGDEIDARADIYSLGMVVYEMLTGRVAFKGRSWTEVVHKQIYEQPESPKKLLQNLPASVEGVILKALQKDRAKRQQTVMEFASGLESAYRQAATAESEEEATKVRTVVPKQSAKSSPPNAPSAPKTRWSWQSIAKNLESVRKL